MYYVNQKVLRNITGLLSAYLIIGFVSCEKPTQNDPFANTNDPPANTNPISKPTIIECRAVYGEPYRGFVIRWNDNDVRQYDEESFPQDEPFYSFIKEGYLPVQWIKNYTNGTRHYNQITKAMRRQRLVVGEAVRKTIDKNTVFALSMTDSLASKLRQREKDDNLVGNVGDLVGDLFN